MSMILRLMFASAMLIAITGCGQKGPLFLPGTPNEMRQVSPPPETAGSEEEDEDEDSNGGQG